MFRLWAVIVAAVCVGMIPCVASAKPVVSLKLSGAFVTKSADGQERFVPVTSRSAHAGERIRWEIVATNSGDQPARRFLPSGKINALTEYIPNSAAAANAKPEYSLDGGKTWSPAPMIMQHTAGGEKLVAADVSQYTAIRWRSVVPLAPGASRRYVYDVVVR